MKWLLILVAAASFLVGTYYFRNATSHSAYVPPKKTVSTCYGYSPCTACSSCSSCKHCNAGGTCGICEKQQKTKPKIQKLRASPVSQCQAITKKGTRCSRSTSNGPYCWQHNK